METETCPLPSHVGRKCDVCPEPATQTERVRSTHTYRCAAHGAAAERELMLSRALDFLTEDGSTFELYDGRTLRLKVEPDDGSPADHWSDDCYGRVEWMPARNGIGPSSRPGGFNGAAHKLHVGRSNDEAWWQPPTDVEPARAADLKREVTRLLEDGFVRVGLELLDGADAYGQPIVVDAAWLGGIDFIGGGYLRDVVDEQLHELSAL